MANFKHISKYELVEEIGRGGFSVVYKARDCDLDRLVALKVLAPHLAWDPTSAKRFHREAQVAAKLRHANIITIYEVNEVEGQLYIAMEYLPGCTLAALLETEGAMPLERVLPILEQVADALDYAHEQGMIHRDVKPSNVMVEEDKRGAVHITLMDFGLVKAMESSESLTSTGTVLGSPQYMAPEQVDHRRKNEVGPATDRYALGVMAYEMLTGEVPFPGNTPSTLVAHMQQAPPDPRTIRDVLPVSVAQALLKALSKSPGDRYPTAMAMVEALRAPMRLKPEPEPQLRPSFAADLLVESQTVDVGDDKSLHGESSATVQVRPLPKPAITRAEDETESAIAETDRWDRLTDILDKLDAETDMWGRLDTLWRIVRRNDTLKSLARAVVGGLVLSINVVAVLSLLLAVPLSDISPGSPQDELLSWVSPGAFIVGGASGWFFGKRFSWRTIFYILLGGIILAGLLAILAQEVSLG